MNAAFYCLPYYINLKDLLYNNNCRQQIITYIEKNTYHNLNLKYSNVTLTICCFSILKADFFADFKRVS